MFRLWFGISLLVLSLMGLAWGCGVKAPGEGNEQESTAGDAGAEKAAEKGVEVPLEKAIEMPAEKEPEKVKDEEAPQISWKGLDDLAEVKGTVQVTPEVSDNVGVAKVELLLDEKVVATVTEKPFALEWDTTKVESGFYEAKLRAYDEAGNKGETQKQMRLIVFNKGKILDVDGNQGTVVIPANYQPGQEIHTRHGWYMPAGTYGMLALVHWKDTSWKRLEIAVGTGTCPHSGKKLAQDRSDSGLAVIPYRDPAGKIIGSQQWFLHVAADEAANEKKGQSLKYTFKLYAFWR